MIIYLEIVSQVYIDTVIVKDLSQTRLIMANLTSFSRNLELTNYGQEGYNEEEMRDFITSDISSFTKLVSVIEDSYNKWDAETRKIFTDSNILTWELISDEKKMTKKDLIDVLKDFLLRSTYLNQDKLSDISDLLPGELVL